MANKNTGLGKGLSALASALILDEFRGGKMGRITLEAAPQPAPKPAEEGKSNAQGD